LVLGIYSEKGVVLIEPEQEVKLGSRLGWLNEYHSKLGLIF
jgi:hypothetical protein